MNDGRKTRSELLAEVAALRRRLDELDSAGRSAPAEDAGACRRTEEALRESQRMLATLLSNLPGMAYRCRNDADWTMEFVSEGCVALTGYQRDDLLANRAISYNECILAEDRPLVREQVERGLAEGRHFQIEYRIRTRSGQRRWVLEQGVGVDDQSGRAVALEGFITDVSERRRAEDALKTANAELERRVAQRTAALRAANEQLRSEVEERRRAEHELAIFKRFADASGRGFGMADLQGVIEYANPTLCRMAGAESASEMVGRHFRDYSPPEDRRQAEEAIVPAVLQHGQWSGERRILTRQGRIVPTLANVFLIRDDAGQPLRLAMAVADLSERKQAEADLAESEAKYRQLVEITGTGYLILDEEGRVVDANPEYVRLSGHRRLDQIKGRNVAEWTAPHDAGRSAEELRKCLRTGRVRQLEIDYLHAGGRITPVEINASGIATQQGSRILLLCRDIAERRRTEETLRQSLDQLQTIYDGITEGLLITDVQSEQFLRANASMCRMLRYSEDELVGASLKDIHPPEEVPDDLERFRAVAQGRRSINEARPVRRKDGTIFYADITGHPIVYDGRRAVLALFRDVTERIQAREALERQRQTLWHMLQASDHERQLIAYEIHDGLTQLITGAMMQYQAYDHLRESQPEKARMAYAMGGEMLHMAHAEARRLISGVRPPVLDEAGVETAIAHLVHDRRILKGLKVEYQSEVQFDRLPRILENALYRIAQEALANACQHSGSARIRVQLVQNQGMIRLEVQDWGAGFDPQAIREGHFGLEGIRQRVRLLGGRLEIDTAQGRGTLLRVEVPLLEQKPAPPA